jgi:hypothetical protein
VLGGPEPGDRTCLALARSTRHHDLVLVIAITNLPKARPLPVVLVFMITRSHGPPWERVVPMAVSTVTSKAGGLQRGVSKLTQGSTTPRRSRLHDRFDPGDMTVRALAQEPTHCIRALNE